MIPDRNNPTIPCIREWLRNDRLLGIDHWAVGASSKMAALENNEIVPASRERARKSRSTPPKTPKFVMQDAELPMICDREFAEPEAREALRQLDDNWVRACKRCSLHQGRTQTVFGEGCARPAIVFVGEGPGAEEDAQGRPFVGRAGQLLTRMIAAMTLTRDQVYICNVVKCRPPQNRTPTEQEAETCWPFLARQIAILRPKVMVALGRPATQTLLQTNAPIGRLRGEFQEFPPLAWQHLGLPKVPVMPTFHPAYLLRSPGEKRKAWEDLQQVMRYLGIPIPTTR